MADEETRSCGQPDPALPDLRPTATPLRPRCQHRPRQELPGDEHRLQPDGRERVRCCRSGLSEADRQDVRLLLPVPPWLQGRSGRPEGYCHRVMLDAVRYYCTCSASSRSRADDLFPDLLLPGLPVERATDGISHLRKRRERTNHAQLSPPTTGVHAHPAHKRSRSEIGWLPRPDT
ncbi:hypothetical protein CA983_06465 [Streptomyces swartbergensis]|uniref:Uncharacterized protein n=1 Tax=Streptomyces swartbergensis TaxID=487165 RepID=A0A243S8L8_9ACTN|nr:hypothetical protein CA983_06465 [Streptomyces swartbergensis]